MMITVWKSNNKEYGIICNDSKIANKINKLLNSYYDTVLTNNDEPIFFVNEDQLDTILRISKRWNGVKIDVQD